VWFLLSASGTALLLAVTGVITMDLASIPFLWILPLCIYLFCYVLTFKRNPWYPTWWPRAMYWSVILGVLLFLITQLRLAIPAHVSIGLHMMILFVVCLTCSGELIRSKPADEAGNLTTFYLVVAAGGLAGSLVVGWVAPLASRSLAEYPFSLLLAVISYALCASAGARTGPDAVLAEGRRKTVIGTVISAATAGAALTALPWAIGLVYGSGEKPGLVIPIALPLAFALRWAAGKPWPFAAALVVAATAMTYTEDIVAGAGGVKKLRNYYGIYKIYDHENMRYLQHGTTLHGRQYIAGPRADVPLSYFHPTTPAAGVLISTNFSFRNIGMIGLGTGALAAYAGNGQTFTIFELDPDNIPIAEKYFTYLGTARRRGARLDFVVGDGRISLRRMPEASLDLLVVDAFNSGSIPVHLLTVEALEEYLRVLGRGGLLLMHVSNRHIDLLPVIRGNALALGAGLCEKTNAGDVDPDADTTQWVALSNDISRIEALEEMGWVHVAVSAAGLPRPWTDRYSNVLGAFIYR
jgi:SAM-dependent methyltransferase